MLFDATAEGDARAVARLLKAGACANAVDSQGDTPLLCAAQAGHMPVVRLLLEAGALVTPANISDETALHVAAWAGHVDVVEALLAAGAPVNCRGPDGEVPLLLAADGGHCDVRAACLICPCHCYAFHVCHPPVLDMPVQFYIRSSRPACSKMLRSLLWRLLA